MVYDYKAMQSFGQSSVRPFKEIMKREMITRSNLAEQLREYQIRSQHNWASLSFFSSTAQIASRADAAKAGLWGLLFFLLLTFSFIALYLRYTWLAFSLVCLAILLPVCLEVIRQISLARKRKRRMFFGGCRADAAKATPWGLLFFLPLTFSFIALYLRYTWLAFSLVCLAILLPVCLEVIRQISLARKRERTMLLPLSM